MLLIALCERTDPREIAHEIGGAGAVELKRRATEAVNERRGAHSDRAFLREVLRNGSAAARDIYSRLTALSRIGGVELHEVVGY